MKVIVTQPDLERLVRGALPNIGASDMTIVFEGTPSVVQGNYIEGIHRAMYENPRHATDQKMSAIKRLRVLVPDMGLVEAKLAIENSQAAIAHFIRHGTFYK